MALNFKCPTCVSLSLTSTVFVEQVQKDVIISRAHFDTDGSVIAPIVKQRVTTLCSNNHRVDNDFNKIPDEILNKIQYFTG